jgi:hypothetical protein
MELARCDTAAEAEEELCGWNVPVEIWFASCSIKRIFDPSTT